MKFFIYLLILLTTALSAADSEPDAGGRKLRRYLKKTYFDGKHRTIKYRRARQYMYNRIDNRDGKVYCVYSGFVKKVSYGGRVSSPMPVNCEHTVPQSFFRKRGPMKSDLHHLFPAYLPWNEKRGHLPLRDIDDRKTIEWMRGEKIRYGIPQDRKDEYSEYDERSFEPREDHKGNVARAVFYFYTMYPGHIGTINRVGSVKTFLKWHKDDPVDEKERRRNIKIAEVQGNLNPYISDPSFAERAWGEFSNK